MKEEPKFKNKSKQEYDLIKKATLNPEINLKIKINKDISLIINVAIIEKIQTIYDILKDLL